TDHCCGNGIHQGILQHMYSLHLVLPLPSPLCLSHTSLSLTHSSKSLHFSLSLLSDPSLPALSLSTNSSCSLSDVVTPLLVVTTSPISHSTSCVCVCVCECVYEWVYV